MVIGTYVLKDVRHHRVASVLFGASTLMQIVLHYSQLTAVIHSVHSVCDVCCQCSHCCAIAVAVLCCVECDVLLCV
jgi:hypothetical protein